MRARHATAVCDQLSTMLSVSQEGHCHTPCRVLLFSYTTAARARAHRCVRVSRLIAGRGSRDARRNTVASTTQIASLRFPWGSTASPSSSSAPVFHAPSLAHRDRSNWPTHSAGHSSDRFKRGGTAVSPVPPTFGVQLTMASPENKRRRTRCVGPRAPPKPPGCAPPTLGGAGDREKRPSEKARSAPPPQAR